MARPFDAAALPQFVRALEFASRKHSTQRRKDADASPYINHPIALVSILAVEAGIDDSDVLCAALLHDTIEDTQTTREELEENFGVAIAGIVLEVTDDKALPKGERKQLQIDHAHALSHAAGLVKLADKIANLRDIAVSPPPDWDLDRRQKYFDWAKDVVAGITHVPPRLRELFDEAYAKKPLPYFPSLADLKESKEGKGGFVLMGGIRNYDAWSEALAAEIAASLRPGEEPLGELTDRERRWLVLAFDRLMQIYGARGVSSEEFPAFCIFDVGVAYVQFHSWKDSNELSAEAVSAESVPEIAAVLTPEKQQLLTKYGFNAPGLSPNYSQRIGVATRADLEYAARLAMRTLKQVYDVRDFNVGRFKIALPPDARRPIEHLF